MFGSLDASHSREKEKSLSINHRGLIKIRINDLTLPTFEDFRVDRVSGDIQHHHQLQGVN